MIGHVDAENFFQVFVNLFNLVAEEDDDKVPFSLAELVNPQCQGCQKDWCSQNLEGDLE